MADHQPTIRSLWDQSAASPDRALAHRYAPVIRFDAQEPFLPIAAGYTIFREAAPSPSFRQGKTIAPRPGADLAIEYAIWWDWDIGHLYELEHVWVHVAEDGEVVGVEASWHGDEHDMRLDGELALEGDHPIVYSEPGKHAFAPTPAWFAERRARFVRSETTDLAGVSGVLVAPYVRDAVRRTPYNTLLVRSYLAGHAFEPSLDFSQVFRFRPHMLVPWPALLAWMPGRVAGWVERLKREVPPEQYRFLRIGHRGASAHAPDNSLRGIEIAAQLGADMVEIDLQRTADGEIVLCHNDFLRDDDGTLLRVRQSTLDELRLVDLGGGERVPTLAQALKRCQKLQIGAYLEIKDGAVLEALAATLEDRDVANHSIVGSFRPDWVADLRAMSPHAITSVLFSAVDLDAFELAHAVGAAYVHPCWERRAPRPSALLTPEWLARVRGAELGVVCWSEQRPEELDGLRNAGVDGICSDQPELLKAAWEARGPWRPR